MKPWPSLLIFLVTLPLGAKEKKPVGEVSDPSALAKIQSYCVDRRDLPGYQAYEVKGFVETESKPKKLLTKLPWKLLPDCRESDPDAIIKIEFQLLNSINLDLGRAQPLDRDEYNVKAVLEVAEAASARTLYKVQALPRTSGTEDSGGTSTDAPPVRRRDALYTAFWTLIEDVQRLSAPKK